MPLERTVRNTRSARSAERKLYRVNCALASATARPHFRRGRARRPEAV